MADLSLALRISTTGAGEAGIAVGGVRSEVKGLEGALTSMNEKKNELMQGLKSYALGLAAAFSIKEIVKIADDMSLLDARLKNATSSELEYANAKEQVYQIAQKNNIGLVEATQLYTKLATPVKNLGGTTKEVGGIVESFALSMRVGGASATEAASATLQFSQAMGSGKLQGDEFHSMTEASPRFMKALADGMGVPIGALKKMGSEGKLTSEVVGNALLKSLGDLRTEGEKIPDTVGGAFTRLANDAKLAIDEMNKASGMTAGIASVIDVIDKLIPAVKSELVGAFKSVSEWIGDNKAKIGEAWDAAKELGKEVWELVKSAGAVAGAILHWALESDKVKDRFTVLRYLVAGVQDGVEILGAVFAKVGAAILNFVASPLSGIISQVGNFASLFDKDLGASIKGFGQNVLDAARASNSYADGVFTKFADGKTNVKELGAAMDKSAADAAQLKGALQGSGVSAADNARELKKLTMASGDSAAGFTTLKGKTTELSKEQKHADDAYAKLVTSIKDKTGVLEQEESQTTKLTAGQKVALGVMQNIQDGTLKLTGKRKLEITSLLEQYLKQEQVTLAQLRGEAATTAARHANEKYIEKLEKQNDGLDAEIKKQQAANDVLSGNKNALIENTAEKYRALAASADRQAMVALERGEDEKQYETLKTQADKYRELADLKENSVYLTEAKKAREEWDKTTSAIGNGLSKNLADAFASGSKFFSTLWSGVQDTFKKTILEPVLKDVITPFSDLFGRVATDIANTVLQPVMKNVITPFVNLFNEAVAYIGGTVFQPAMKNVVSPLMDLFGLATKNIGDTVLAPGMKDAIGPMLRKFELAADDIAKTELAPTMEDVNTPFYEDWQEVENTIDATVLTPTFEDINSPFYQEFQEVEAGIGSTTLSPTMKDVMNPFAAATRAVFKWVDEYVLSPLMKNVVSPLWDAFKATASDIGNTVLSPLLKDLWTGFKSLFNTVADGINNTLISPAFSTGGLDSWLGALSSGLNTVLGWFGTSWQGILGKVGTTLGSLVDGVYSLFGGTGGTDIGAWFSALGGTDGGGGGGGGGGSGVVGTATTGAGLIGSGVQLYTGITGGTGTGIAGSIGNWLGAQFGNTAAGTAAGGAAAGGGATVGGGVTAGGGAAAGGAAAAGGGLSAAAGLGVIGALFSAAYWYQGRNFGTPMSGYAGTDATINDGANPNFGAMPTEESDDTKRLWAENEKKRPFFSTEKGPADAFANATLQQTVSGYAQLAQALGGKPGNLTGSVYAYTNPGNSDPNVLLFDAKLNGTEVYSRNNRSKSGITTTYNDEGKGEADLIKAAELASTQAILRALQETDLGAALNQQLDYIDTNSSAATIKTELARLIKSRGVPGFAAGGWHSGGLRLVGEGGMELEATGPARYYSAPQTRDLLSAGSGAGQAAVVTAIDTLRAELLAAIMTGDTANAAQTQRVASILDRVMPKGDALTVRLAA